MLLNNINFVINNYIKSFIILETNENLHFKKIHYFV
jgi:hypothetical protein